MRRPEERGAPLSSQRGIVRPSLQAARAQGLVAEKRGWLGHTNLLEQEPISSRPALALVVRALVQTRTWHDREDELGPRLLRHLVAAASHEPTRRLEASSWQCAVAVHDTRPRPCSACTLKPGSEMCARCGGTGRVLRNDDPNARMICFGCERGWVPCTRCEGGKETSRVTVRTFEERVGELEHVFVPRLPTALVEAIEASLLAEDELPAELRVDLDRASVSLGDYRGSAKHSAPHFHGIDASDVLPEARATLTRMAAAGTFIERVVEAHAVPLLLCEHDGWTVALAALGERMLAFSGERT